MKTLSEIKATNGVIVLEESTASCCGWIYQRRGKRLFFVAEWGTVWECVSVSNKNKIPSWDDMYLAKNTFWNDNEFVVQYYPSINNSPHCLQLWRPVGTDIPIPPKILV